MSWIANWLFPFLQSLFAFIVILVPLVVFHEFGHFVFAKLFGVKAEVFSVGFGPKLWSRQFGETEFRVAAIPMGGFVKLLGEDRESPLPESEQHRALHKQKPWKRFLIFFGGPLFNFILAIFLFMAILVIGEQHVASVIGRVVHHSPAEKAGLQSGDHVLAVNGQPVKKFEEIHAIMAENPGKPLDFQVVHPHQKQPVTIHLMTSTETGYSIYGETTAVGDIEGMLPLARATDLGVSDPASVAGKAGLGTGDKVIEFDQVPVSTWEEIEMQYEQIPAAAHFTLKIQKAKSKNIQSISLEKPTSPQSLGQAYGLYSSELFVENVVSKSPAKEAGIKTGDRLVAIGKVEVESFFALKDAVQRDGEKEGHIQVTWEHDGQKHTEVITPTATSKRDPVLNKSTQFTIGVVPKLALAEPKTVVERIWNPFKLVYTATERMVTFSWRNLVSLKKMFSGDVSVGNLGGPITIGKIAGESMARGLIAFLTNMAIFSIGLGVLNVLPVPVLDGGHLLLLSVEIVRGKPLSLRQMEIAQGIGLLFILALMGIAFSNDIARLFYS